MKQLILSIILVAFISTLSIPTATAQIDVGCDWNMNCTGGKLYRFADCVVNNVSVTVNESVSCDYGCDDKLDTCNPPRLNQLVVVGSIIAFIIGLYIVLNKVK